jgi:hypothetical protein
MFEEIKSMKQLTVADRGLMVALADMLFHAINRYFPVLTKKNFMTALSNPFNY